LAFETDFIVSDVISLELVGSTLCTGCFRLGKVIVGSTGCAFKSRGGAISTSVTVINGC